LRVKRWLTFKTFIIQVFMDDLTLRYYDAEMRYLLEAGEEFARAHPEQAAMLNLDKAGARDPYVERLFEGFAFLMGRLREKLDDDLPELTEGLVSLLWPHYLRTIPSMSVVEFTPDWREMKEQMRIVKGFEVNSRPIGERARAAGTPPPKRSPFSRCRWSTPACRLTLTGVRSSACALTAAILPTGAVSISARSLYFNADAPLACAMHEAFTMNTARLWLRMPGDMDRRPLDGYFTALGFGDDDDACGRRAAAVLAVISCCWSISPREIHVHRPAWAGAWSFRLSSLV
jgi:type VI secretion system protein ImpG